MKGKKMTRRYFRNEFDFENVCKDFKELAPYVMYQSGNLPNKVGQNPRNGPCVKLTD